VAKKQKARACARALSLLGTKARVTGLVTAGMTKTHDRRLEPSQASVAEATSARSGQGSAWPDFVGGFASESDVSCECSEFGGVSFQPTGSDPAFADAKLAVHLAGRIRIFSCIYRF
jgi:hypothetical protein